MIDIMNASVKQLLKSCRRVNDLLPVIFKLTVISMLQMHFKTLPLEQWLFNVTSNISLNSGTFCLFL